MEELLIHETYTNLYNHIFLQRTKGFASSVAGGKRMKLTPILGKKGQVFENLSGLGVGIAALAIVLVVAFLILSNIESNSQVAADPNATRAVRVLADSADDIPDWVPLVVIAVVGAILLGLVAVFRQGR